MDEQRLNDKKIDLIIDMDVLKPSTSVQLGIRKLQEEGASIFPRILLPAGEEADYRVISKLLSLLNIGEEELLTDFIIAHDFCSLQKHDRYSLHGNRFGICWNNCTITSCMNTTVYTPPGDMPPPPR